MQSGARISLIQKKREKTSSKFCFILRREPLHVKLFTNKKQRKDHSLQGFNARKVNCGRVYSGYILKPVLSGRNL